MGIQQQLDLFSELSIEGRPPLVIDAADFLKSPELCLRKLCDLAEVAFEERMLSWPAGPRASDGVWAPYWYDSVRRSTGFEPYVEREVSLSAWLEELAGECAPMYARLHDQRWLP